MRYGILNYGTRSIVVMWLGTTLLSRALTNYDANPITPKAGPIPYVQEAQTSIPTGAI